MHGIAVPRRRICRLEDLGLVAVGLVKLSGVQRRVASELVDEGKSPPLNLGQDRMVTINQLADMIAAIAGISVRKVHVPGPQGVRGRNSDNRLIHSQLGWKPNCPLRAGLEKTYAWISAQVQQSLPALSKALEREESSQPVFTR